MVTDVAFLLRILEDGEKHTTGEILSASFSERGCGLTVHSRAADLRAAGHLILCENEGKVKGRSVYSYRLLSLSPQEISEPLTGSVPPNGESCGVRDAAGRGSESLFDMPAAERKPSWA